MPWMADKHPRGMCCSMVICMHVAFAVRHCAVGLLLPQAEQQEDSQTTSGIYAAV